MAKELKKLVHATYNRKVFLSPNSINSMSAIHCKIKSDGTAILRISDCNNAVRIWNDFNSKTEKLEMIEKLTTLIDHIEKFRDEISNRVSNIDLSKRFGNE
jgi:hypothetical protein